MEELEKITQKQLIGFCKFLPIHVNTWSLQLEASLKSLQSLLNFSEQLNHVEKANLTDVFEDFEYLQNALQFSILSHIDEEIVNIKQIIGRLTQSNWDLKTKLSHLEKSSTNLDWEGNLTIISGNGTQPPLGKLLQMSYEFFLYFQTSLKNINESLKLMNVRDYKSVTDLKQAFNAVNLKTDNVTFLLAITQYVDNEKAII